jgi:hypothetical protein
VGAASYREVGLRSVAEVPPRNQSQECRLWGVSPRPWWRMSEGVQIPHPACSRTASRFSEDGGSPFAYRFDQVLQSRDDLLPRPRLELVVRVHPEALAGNALFRLLDQSEATVAG